MLTKGELVVYKEAFMKKNVFAVWNEKNQSFNGRFHWIWVGWIEALEEALPDYKEVLADHNRIAREMDVAMNGAGAAKQASLCDIQGQLNSIMRERNV